MSWTGLDAILGQINEQLDLKSNTLTYTETTFLANPISTQQNVLLGNITEFASYSDLTIIGFFKLSSENVFKQYDGFSYDNTTGEVYADMPEVNEDGTIYDLKFYLLQENKFISNEITQQITIDNIIDSGYIRFSDATGLNNTVYNTNNATFNNDEVQSVDDTTYIENTETQGNNELPWKEVSLEKQVRKTVYVIDTANTTASELYLFKNFMTEIDEGLSVITTTQLTINSSPSFDYTTILSIGDRIGVVYTDNTTGEYTTTNHIISGISYSDPDTTIDITTSSPDDFTTTGVTVQKLFYINSNTDLSVEDGGSFNEKSFPKEDTILNLGTAITHDVFEDNSIVATYQFDGDATDLGGSYDGTLSGTTSFSVGKIDDALFVDSGGNAVMNIGGSLECISVWLYFDREITSSTDASSYGEYARVLSTKANSAYYITLGSLITGGSIGFRFDDYYTAINKTISIGWHHFVIQWNSTLGQHDWFMDGVQETSVESGTAVQQTALYLTLGKRYGTSTQHWDGGFDQLRVFNRALTANEVNALFNENVTTNSFNNLGNTNIPISVSTLDIATQLNGIVKTADTITPDGDIFTYKYNDLLLNNIRLDNFPIRGSLVGEFKFDNDLTNTEDTATYGDFGFYNIASSITATYTTNKKGEIDSALLIDNDLHHSSAVDTALNDIVGDSGTSDTSWSQFITFKVDEANLNLTTTTLGSHTIGHVMGMATGDDAATDNPANNSLGNLLLVKDGSTYKLALGYGEDDFTLFNDSQFDITAQIDNDEWLSVGFSKEYDFNATGNTKFRFLILNQNGEVLNYATYEYANQGSIVLNRTAPRISVARALSELNISGLDFNAVRGSYDNALIYNKALTQEEMIQVLINNSEYTVKTLLKGSDLIFDKSVEVYDV